MIQHYVLYNLAVNLICTHILYGLFSVRIMNLVNISVSLNFFERPFLNRIQILAKLITRTFSEIIRPKLYIYTYVQNSKMCTCTSKLAVSQILLCGKRVS